MRCKTHKIGFTLYPYGYYPYSRHTLAPVDMEGNLLTKSYPKDSLFIGTLFEAATDAGNGIPWPSASEADSMKPRFPTQIRHMWRSTILLGVAPGMEQSLREEISQLLTLPGQLLNDTSNQIVLSTCGYQCWGKEICTLLQHIPAGTLFERLVEVGANAGLWPQPLFLTNNMLQQSPFHRVRMRGSPKKTGDH